MAAGRLHQSGRASTGGTRPGRLLAWMGGLSILSLAPDADVLAFVLRIPYGAPFGHRGAAHSLLVALAVGILAGMLARRLGGAAVRIGVLCSLVVASHGLLDTLTDGGLGIALLWPWSDERLFAPIRPFEVAPLGLGMLSGTGLRVALWEAAWFSPLFAYALWPRRGGRAQPL